MSYSDEGLVNIFQSTLPLRGATRFIHRTILLSQISIHAPLTGSDKYFPYDRLFPWISIHAPLTGSDLFQSLFSAAQRLFQSTLPLRGATIIQSIQKNDEQNFNPRSPYGERLFSGNWTEETWHFNPRSPYGERLWQQVFALWWKLFQSTLPLRGATHTVDQKK